MAHTADPAAVVVDQETLIQGVRKTFPPQGLRSPRHALGHQVLGPGGIGRPDRPGGLPEHDGPGPCRPGQAGPAVAPVCGVCGTTVQAGPPGEPRAVTTTVGTVDWIEPKR